MAMWLLDSLMFRGSIERDKTGIYIAYPTSHVLKPIYRGYKTLVNDRHTKVGIASISFAKREECYISTFEGEVVFIPLLDVPKNSLSVIEKELIRELRKHHTRVGRAREWFDTADRDSLANQILTISAQLLRKL